MSQLKPDIQVNGADLFTQIAPTAGTVPYMTQVPELGVRAVTGDGREFRYVQAGASNLVAGNLQQSAAVIANVQNVTCPTVAIGGSSFAMTISATTITAGQFVGGTLIINAGTGLGQTLKILSHSAGTSITAFTVVTEDVLTVATDVGSSKASVYPNLYKDTIICPVTATGTPIGIPLYAMTATYYGWLQVKGACAALNSGGVTVGLGMSPNYAGSGTAGALIVAAATTPRVAEALQAATTTEYNLVNLMLN